MHNPERADYVQENRRQGGRHRAPYKFAPELETNFEALELRLLHPLEFQASLEAVLRMVLLGRIPRQTAAVIMRYFEVAARTLPHLNGWSLSDQNRDYYFDQVGRLCYASDLIEEQLQDQRTQERVETLSDIRSRYEERFRTEDQWGRAPRKR